MRLRKELKKSLALNLLSKYLIFAMVVAPSFAYADPVVAGQILPPGSFTYIDDYETLRRIHLDGGGGAWCYDNDANAILITAPANEKAKCELTLMYELEKQKTRYEFQVDKLNLRIETLLSQNKKILQIKNEEIDKLTAAAMNAPNDYTAWWASGGFVVGVAVSVATYFLIR